jgi:hypothetical protein
MTVKNEASLQGLRLAKRTGYTVGLLILAGTFLPGCRSYLLDKKLETLCEKDGGTKVFETVTLNPSEYDALFARITSSKVNDQEGMLGPEYRYVGQLKVVEGSSDIGKPGKRLTRRYQRIERQADNRVLAERVTYYRTILPEGGDPDMRACPHSVDAITKDVFKRRQP